METLVGEEFLLVVYTLQAVAGVERLPSRSLVGEDSRAAIDAFGDPGHGLPFALERARQEASLTAAFA